jgi:hypothetical protein
MQVYYPYLLMNKKRYAGLLWTKPDKWDKMDSKVGGGVCTNTWWMWGRGGAWERSGPGQQGWGG